MGVNRGALAGAGRAGVVVGRPAVALPGLRTVGHSGTPSMRVMLRVSLGGPAGVASARGDGLASAATCKASESGALTGLQRASKTSTGRSGVWATTGATVGT